MRKRRRQPDVHRRRGRKLELPTLRHDQRPQPIFHLILIRRVPMQRNDPHVRVISKRPLQPPPLILQPHQLVIGPAPAPARKPSRIRRARASPMIIAKPHETPIERTRNLTLCRFSNPSVDQFSLLCLAQDYPTFSVCHGRVGRALSPSPLYSGERARVRGLRSIVRYSPQLSLRHSGFGLLSSFGLRHSTLSEFQA